MIGSETAVGNGKIVTSPQAGLSAGVSGLEQAHSNLCRKTLISCGMRDDHGKSWLALHAP